ncbi:MAG TPA: flagellar export protein FliJ [Thermotogota bacterium]|nr:flagellar export protein FliJ [Thermotogota bacterium]HRW93057.1 flagellar export protein FliJ [Thermotogota bacterium]
MKRFQFRLQRILDVFIKRVEQARLEISRLLGVRAGVEFRIQNQQLSIRQQQSTFAEQLGKGKLLPNDVMVWMHFLDAEFEELAQLYKELEKVNRELDRAREEYRQLDRNKKSLEKLKEKQFDQFSVEFQRVEQYEMDEIASRISWNPIQNRRETWHSESGNS